MPYASNRIDGTRVYYEDHGGEAPPVVVHGGFLDSVASIDASKIVQAISPEFRVVVVDHRGLGKSDKPHEPVAYAMRLRVADAVAVLDEAGIQRAHFIGLSWGGRLVFGIGEYAPERVLSLIIGGQQPYAWPDSPLTRVVTDGLQRAQAEGTLALIESMERFWGTRLPDGVRSIYLANDAAALQAAWTQILAEGAVSDNLRSWQVRCLIFMGAGDADFVEQARRAAMEIPDAEFLSLAGLDHIGAHFEQGDPTIESVFRTLRGARA